MRGEIPQSHPELQPSIFYPIWSEKEVASWLANPKSPEGWFYGALRSTYPTPRVYRKPFFFGGHTIAVLLSDQPPYIMSGRRIQPYPQEVLPLLAQSIEESFPLYMGVSPESEDYQELTGRRVKLWIASHTIQFGDGQPVNGTLETRSKLNSNEDSIISISRYSDDYGNQHPLIILPNNPQLICQAKISFHHLRQALRERDPYSHPVDPWDWRDGKW